MYAVAYALRILRSPGMEVNRLQLIFKLVVLGNDFNKFFQDKVAAIRSGTAGAPDPTFSAVRTGVSLSSFSTIPVIDVITRQELCS